MLLTVLPVFCLLYKIVVFHITQRATEILTNILMTKQLETVDQIYSCLVPKLCSTPCNSIDSVHQAPLSMEFSRQEYSSGLPFPSPGDATQGLNLYLLHCRQIFFTESPGKPRGTVHSGFFKVQLCVTPEFSRHESLSLHCVFVHTGSFPVAALGMR